MSTSSSPVALPQRAWRILAALLAAVAIVLLIHWHPLFEDSGSETLRDAANQCAACVSTPSAPAAPAAPALALLVVSRIAAAPEANPAAPRDSRTSVPRAPPC